MAHAVRNSQILILMSLMTIRPKSSSSALSRHRLRDSDVEEAPLISIRSTTSWEISEDIRRFVEAFCRNRFTKFLAERVTLASQELLQNAVDYCSVASEVVYELRHSESRRMVEVRVSNTAVQSRIAVLQKRVLELRDVDPAKAYAMAMRSLAERGGSSSAMLGLARVRNEAGMSIRVKVDGSRVTVIAQGRD